MNTPSSFRIKPLDEATWPDFVRLAEAHNGVWGGCWCMEFHPEGKRRGAQRREQKECRVRQGKAHAALVYDREDCVGWCQFGSPDELPRIKSLREYRKGLTILPSWRITCFFVAKTHRGRGVAAAALQGALQEIAKLGGGKIESYPEATDGRSVSGSFLHNGTMSMFERNGFERDRQIGKNRWVVSRTVRRRLAEQVIAHTNLD